MPSGYIFFKRGALLYYLKKSDVQSDKNKKKKPQREICKNFINCNSLALKFLHFLLGYK